MTVRIASISMVSGLDLRKVEYSQGSEVETMNRYIQS